MITISLIGEQPIPNLLPLLYEPPEMAILVHTERTKSVAERLQRVLDRRSIKAQRLPTDPYDIRKIWEDLRGFLINEGLERKELVFNLTGGTKTMVLAAYELAREHQAQFLYLQSEGKSSVLYRYRFEGTGPCYETRETLKGVITIEDYLKVHREDYQEKGPAQGFGGRFESAIANALQGVVDEVKVGVTIGGAMELDLIVRIANQVGVIQAKTGKTARTKEGLREVKSACSREYLGTYTAKMLVINQQWDHSQDNLRELADNWDVTVIHLPSFTENACCLSDDDREHLRREVVRVLTGQEVP